MATPQREREISRVDMVVRAASTRVLGLKAIGGLLLFALAGSPAQAGWFSSHLDDFKDLVKAGKLDDAGALVQQYPDYFTKLQEPDHTYVADTLGQPERAALDQALVAVQAADADIAPMRRWSKLKTTMQAARDEIAKAQKIPLRSPAVDEGIAALQTCLDLVTQKLQADSGAALKVYGLFSSPAFTSVYPIGLTSQAIEKTILDADFVTTAQHANPAHLKTFAQVYFRALPKGSEVIKQATKIYLADMFRERSAVTWQQKWHVMRDAQQIGFDTIERARNGVLIVTWPNDPNSGIQFTPPTLFPTIELQPGESPAAFLKNDLPHIRPLPSLDVVVFVHPYSAVATRTTDPTQTFTSTYVSGTQQVPNPDYASQQNDVAEARSTLALAQQELNQAQANANSSTFAAIAAATAVGVYTAAQVSLQDAQNKLAQTPQTLTQNVMSNYSYQRTDVKIEKTSVVAFAVYDVGTGNVYSNVGDRNVDSVTSNWKTFLISGVNNTDPNFSAIMSGWTDQKHLDAYQASPIVSNYDGLLPLGMNHGY